MNKTFCKAKHQGIVYFVMRKVSDQRRQNALFQVKLTTGGALKNGGADLGLPSNRFLGGSIL